MSVTPRLLAKSLIIALWVSMAEACWATGAE